MNKYDCFEEMNIEDCMRIYNDLGKVRSNLFTELSISSKTTIQPLSNEDKIIWDKIDNIHSVREVIWKIVIDRK